MSINEKKMSHTEKIVRKGAAAGNKRKLHFPEYFQKLLHTVLKNSFKHSG